MVATFPFVASAAAQTAEADAVKQTLENYANAISARDLELLLSFVAADAQIDSRAAGKKANKQEYREAVARVPRNIDGAQLRNLKVTFKDAENAVVDGEAYIRAGGQMNASYNQWRLQKRDGCHWRKWQRSCVRPKPTGKHVGRLVRKEEPRILSPRRSEEVQDS